MRGEKHEGCAALTAVVCAAILLIVAWGSACWRWEWARRVTLGAVLVTGGYAAGWGRAAAFYGGAWRCGREGTGNSEE